MKREFPSDIRDPQPSIDAITKYKKTDRHVIFGLIKAYGNLTR